MSEIIAKFADLTKEQWLDLLGKQKQVVELIKKMQKQQMESYKLVHSYYCRNELTRDAWEVYEQWHNYFLQKIREIAKICLADKQSKEAKP